MNYEIFKPNEKNISGKRRQTKRKEITVQEMELSRLYTVLGSNLKDPNSIFQMFVSNCPEALNHLLDRCLIDDIGALR